MCREHGTQFEVFHARMTMGLIACSSDQPQAGLELRSDEGSRFDATIRSAKPHQTGTFGIVTKTRVYVGYGESCVANFMRSIVGRLIDIPALR
jgi:hypothetical protein